MARTNGELGRVVGAAAAALLLAASWVGRAGAEPDESEGLKAAVIEVDRSSAAAGKGGGRPKPPPPPPASSPPARIWHSLTSNGSALSGETVCRAGDSRLYLFAGAGSDYSFLSDLWYFCDGSGWALGPTGRTKPDGLVHVAWSCGNGLCVAANGRRGLASSIDTWIYDTFAGEWSMMNCRKGPCPSRREKATMAFDASRGYHVLFGGEHGNTDLDDTLTFDGSKWSSQLPAHSPTPRGWAGAVFVPGSPGLTINRVVLFGGQEVGVRTLCDMHSWSGSDWEPVIQENSGPCLRAHSMAWVTNADGSGQPGLMVSGGFLNAIDDTPNDDVWYFLFTSATSGYWVLGNPLSCDGELVERHAVMALDGPTQKKVFFGGDTWDANERRWILSDRTVVCE